MTRNAILPGALAVFAALFPSSGLCAEPARDAASIIELGRACHMVPEECAAPGTFAKAAPTSNSNSSSDCAQALPMLRQACAEGSGNTMACCALGYAYRSGSFVKQDFFAARTLLEATCKKGQGGVPACARLAELYLHGWGGPEDSTKAVDTVARACEHGEANACKYQCIMFLEGLGVPYDAGHGLFGARFCERACDLGMPGSCWHLGSYLRGGAVAPRNIKRARALFDKACRMGHAQSCTELQNTPKQ